MARIHLPVAETQETRVPPLGLEDPGVGKRQSTPVFLLKIPSTGRLAGYTVHGTAKRLHVERRAILNHQTYIGGQKATPGSS